MKKRAVFAILLMGFTSLFIQTLLIREFLISFYGNEFIIGVILANWILLTALGSGLFSRACVKTTGPRTTYALLQIAIAVYLPAAVFLIRIVKNLLGLAPGEGAGIISIFSSSLLILLPLGLISGAQFPYLCRILSDTSGRSQNSGARVYILEACGFIIAGPLFMVFLAARADSFSIAFMLGMLNLLCAILLIQEKTLNLRNKYLIFTAGFLFIISALALSGPAGRLQEISIDQQYRGLKVLKSENSLYGNLTVTGDASEYTFFNDGIPVITAPIPDIAYTQDTAHFAMLSCPEPENILLLGGCAGGIINETLKYPVKKITYVELDPLLIKLLKEFPTNTTLRELNDPRVIVVNTDASMFLRFQSPQRAYDVIILNLPLPSTLQLNRFYTAEFFRAAASCLKPQGVLLLSLPGSLNYLSPQLRALNSCILNTLRNELSVFTIPGNYNLYLAKNEDFKITPLILSQGLQERSVRLELFNDSYLQERLSRQWLMFFNDSLKGHKNARKNLDLSPSAVFYSLSQWNSVFSPQIQGIFRVLDKLTLKSLLIAQALALLVLLAASAAGRFSRRSALGFAICATGFTAMALNLMIIYAYQAFCGYIFTHIALLSASFMAGLASGGWLITGRLDKIKNSHASFIKIEVGIGLFLGLAILVFNNLAPRAVSTISASLFTLSMICGFVTGMEFPLANRIWQEQKGDGSSSGKLYALDLAGAYLAAIAVSAALVPVVGIIKSCVFLLVLKIISLILLMI